MLRRVTFVTTDVSEERIASIISMKRMGEPQGTRRHGPEDGILHIQVRENLKS
jgi:hypothetical protein